MTFHRVVLFSIFLICWGFSCLAQQYPSAHYTTLNGLPNNAIRSLHMDSRGLLWIGTENGLSKMENGVFENFNESDGLAFNSCWAIAEDSIGHMWFGSYGGGVTKFDGESFQAFSKKDGLIDEKIHKLFIYKDKVYVGTSNGLSTIDIHTNQVYSVKESRSDHPQNYISGFFVHKDQLYYATYGNGIYRVIDFGQETGIKKVQQHQLIFHLSQIGEKIFSSNKGFVEEFQVEDFLNNPKSGKAFGQSIVWDYAVDNQDNLYAASWGIYTKDGGLYKLEGSKMVDMSQSFGISSKVIIATAYDKVRNVLYAGSNDKGLYAVRLDSSILFHAYQERPVLGFDQNETHEIILHQEGVAFRNKSTGNQREISRSQFKKIKDNYVQKNHKSLPKHTDHFFELDFTISSADLEFYGLYHNHENFWVNTNIGIYEFNSEGKILTYLPVHTYCMGFTPEGDLIESNPYGGVRVYQDAANMENIYYSDQLKSTPAQLSKIITTKDAIYFASVFHGLFKWQDGKFKSFIHEGLWEEDKLKNIHLRKEGDLVIASEFGDVFIAEIKPNFHIREKIDRKTIVGNSILFVESYKGHLLIGTERGLNIYKDGRIRYFDEEQGLVNRLFLSAKVMGEELFIGTSSGYYVLQLEKLLKVRDYDLQLALTAVTINHEPSPRDQFSWFTYKHDLIDLPHHKNTVYLEFKPIGHEYPEKLQYRYRMHPDAEWSPYRKETRMDLPYLPYSSFNIEVEVYDRHTGIASIYPLFDLTVHPPLYFRTWFLVLLGMLFLVNLWFVYRLRVNMLRKREQKKAAIEKRMVETKLEALCSQMNPHFTFNAINSIQYYILKNDTDKALAYLGKFSRLIRNTLDNSSKPRITLMEELAYLQSYVSIENSRIENRVTFKMELDQRVDPKSIYLPPMLIQPFVENVFVHAFDSSHPDPQLTLTFNYHDENVLTCKVRDNGIGVVPGRANKFHESKGLKLVKERLQLLPGAIDNALDIFSVPGEGTVVSLRFAVSHVEILPIN